MVYSEGSDSLFQDKEGNPIVDPLWDLDFKINEYLDNASEEGKIKYSRPEYKFEVPSRIIVNIEEVFGGDLIIDYEGLENSVNNVIELL